MAAGRGESIRFLPSRTAFVPPKIIFRRCRCGREKLARNLTIMNPLTFILGEKLRQRHLAAELKRSRELTSPKSITPLFDAIAAISRRTGKSGDEITAEHYNDESLYPEITAAINGHKPKTVAALEAARKSQSLIMKPSPATPTKAPAPSAPAVKLTSAADYQKAIAPPSMTMAEFHKLQPLERSRWIREGGKLVD
jgi:hypothetical protein